jgi:hypothetical protein
MPMLPGGGTAVITPCLADLKPLPDHCQTPVKYYYQHKDWLGTVRLQSDLEAQTVYYDRAFAPYGEIYDNFGNSGYLNFAGDTQEDSPTYGLFDTPNRELQPSQRG